MDQPSAADLFELIMIAEASIDTQFQFWITITFATIVASFVSRNLLTTQMRVLISSLYLIATVVVASRWYYDVEDILAFNDMLGTLGHTPTTPLITALSRGVLMILGTFSTLYFVFRSWSEDSLR